VPSGDQGVVTVPGWFVEEINDLLDKGKTRHTSQAEVLVQAYLFWKQAGMPERFVLKRRGRWIREVLEALEEPGPAHGKGDRSGPR
jgi:hypothetical protein